MRARLGLGLAICLAVAGVGCPTPNPDWDDPNAGSESDEGSSDTDPDPETGEGSEMPVCELPELSAPRVDVPQTCGPINDALGLWQRYLRVDEFVDDGQVLLGSYCDATCTPELCPDDAPVPIEFGKLPLTQIAKSGDCLRVTARRLDFVSECRYEALLIEKMINGITGDVLLFASTNEALNLSDLEPGRPDFEFGLDDAEQDSCECSGDAGSCCNEYEATMLAYELAGGTVSAGAPPAPVSYAGKAYDFYPFDARRRGACDAPAELTWAILAE